jgi:hypothetical protein
VPIKGFEGADFEVLLPSPCNRSPAVACLDYPGSRKLAERGVVNFEEPGGLAEIEEPAFRFDRELTEFIRVNAQCLVETLITVDGR